MNELKYGNYIDDPPIKGLDRKNQEYAVQDRKNRKIANSYIEMFGGKYLSNEQVLERLEKTIKEKQEEIKYLKMAIDMARERIDEKAE